MRTKTDKEKRRPPDKASTQLRTLWRAELKEATGAEACRIVLESAELLRRSRHNDYEKEALPGARRLSRLGPAILQYLHVLRGHKPAARSHHFIECRQESIDLFLGGDDLNNHRQVLRELQNLGRVNMI